jgi:hypothetical protein
MGPRLTPAPVRAFSTCSTCHGASMAGIERAVYFLPLVGSTSTSEDQVMFSVHCPTHGTEVLLSERRIEAIAPTAGGHALRWRCWCGTTGTSIVPRLPTDVLVGRHRPAV